MDEMITVYLYGKKYTVPSSLTITEAAAMIADMTWKAKGMC